MMILPNSEQMRQIDQCAINEFKIPGIVLMENAGAGTVHLMERLLGSAANKHFPIFIGPGNNGGDGLVIARHLHQGNAVPLLVFLIEPERLKGDSATNLAIVEKLGLKTLICSSSSSLHEISQTIDHLSVTHGPPGALVDSIFGTGLDRSVEGHFAEAIELISELSRVRGIPVIAVDTPSGLGSDSGTVLGCCIKAWTTATYGYAKVGQVLPDNLPHVGDLNVIDIGIPPEVLGRVQVNIAAIDQHDLFELSNSLKRPANSHKGNYGHLLILGGSPGKTGAALLAARGAIRSGCGLVSICAPSGLNPIYESALAEAMTVVVKSPDFLSIDDRETILEHLADKTCVVIGPGTGQQRETAELVLFLYEQLTIPMVIDADALNILARRKKDIGAPSGPRILTPHPGEMARLLGVTTKQVQADRRAALQSCYDEFKTPDSELIIILKGSASLTTGGEMVWLNRTGNPAMAAGGMGDVLSGLVGSFICQGMKPVDASRYGVYLHGCCGDDLQTRTGAGFSASDLADELPTVLGNIMRGYDENRA
ncbi:MAG: NAD(P)H-hydrate dehydratase [Desulfofustis sp.]|nr:NAD(P)H-hydrate dehydratase [Desulfofustis sp.]